MFFTGHTMTFIPFARVIARTVSRPDTPTIPEAPDETGAAATAKGPSARTVAKRAAGRFLQSENIAARRLRMAPPVYRARVNNGYADCCVQGQWVSSKNPCESHR